MNKARSSGPRISNHEGLLIIVASRWIIKWYPANSHSDIYKHITHLSLSILQIPHAAWMHDNVRVPPHCVTTRVLASTIYRLSKSVTSGSYKSITIHTKNSQSKSEIAAIAPAMPGPPDWAARIYAPSVIQWPVNTAAWVPHPGLPARPP